MRGLARHGWPPAIERSLEILVRAATGIGNRPSLFNSGHLRGRKKKRKEIQKEPKRC